MTSSIDSDTCIPYSTKHEKIKHLFIICGVYFTFFNLGMEVIILVAIFYQPSRMQPLTVWHKHKFCKLRNCCFTSVKRWDSVVFQFFLILLGFFFAFKNPSVLSCQIKKSSLLLKFLLSLPFGLRDTVVFISCTLRIFWFFGFFFE